MKPQSYILSDAPELRNKLLPNLFAGIAALPVNERLEVVIKDFKQSTAAIELVVE
jgi:hypothetical protein